MDGHIAALLYLAAGVLFILALRGLSSPASSRRGNLYGMIGMGIAVGTTLIAATPEAGAVKFCENGAKAVNWEATRRRVDAAFFARHSVSQLREQSDYWLEYQGRLSEPVRYEVASDRYLPISWDDAFALIAHHLNARRPCPWCR